MKGKKVAYIVGGIRVRIGHIIADEQLVYSIEWNVKNPASLPRYWNLTHREFEIHVRLGHIEIVEEHANAATS